MKANTENKESIEYLYHAINDIQSTIRAIDTKSLGILIVLLIPFNEIGDLRKFISVLINPECSFSFLIHSLSFLFWMLSSSLSLLSILGISNPKEHIKKLDEVEGNYYGGSLFKINFFQMFTTKNIKTKDQFNKIVKSFEQNNLNLLNELVFEHTKLVYIRELKQKRHHNSFVFLFLFAIFSLFIITVYG